MQVEVIHNAASAFAEHALAVRVVYHEEDVIFFRHLVQVGERGDITVHAEDAVRHDQGAAVF